MNNSQGEQVHYQKQATMFPSSSTAGLAGSEASREEKLQIK